MSGRYRAPFRGYRSALIWLYCCLWVYPLFGQNWHRKWWYIGGGFLGTVKMEVGLRRFHVSIHCGATEQVQGGNFVTDRLAKNCDFMHKYDGEWELSELYDHACLTEEATLSLMRGCGTATLLYWSSMLVYVLLLASITTLLVCAFLVLYFETGDPTSKWKRWCQILYFMSFGTQFCMVFAYSAFNLNLNELYQPMYIAGGIGKIVFNSPSTVWLTASFTAWYALFLLGFGFVLSWWTVLDLSVSDQLFEELMIDGPGLNPLEKEVLFGGLAGATGYGATPGPYDPGAPAAAGYGAPPDPYWTPAGVPAAGTTAYGTPAADDPRYRGADVWHSPGPAPSEAPAPYDQYAAHGYPAPAYTSQY